MSADHRYLCLNGHHVVSKDADLTTCSAPIRGWPGADPEPCGSTLQPYQGPNDVFIDESESVTSLIQSVRRMVEDGHPCGSPAADDWFRIMCERLAQVENGAT